MADKIKSPRITRNVLRGERKYNSTINNIADDMETDRPKVLRQINQLGILVNRTLRRKGGKVYFRDFNFPHAEERVVDYLRTYRDLIDFAETAYKTFSQDSKRGLYIFDGEKERRWQPELHNYEELYQSKT